MLCSQIRLTERRRRYCGVPQESVLSSSSLSSTTLKGACPSTGNVSRPCVIRNVSNTTSKKIRGSGERKNDDDNDDVDVNDNSNGQSNDVEVHHRSIRVHSSRREKVKLPLRVLSVRMQPGTKTLAPEDIRRDPRKLPSFCEQFKQIKRTRSPLDQQSPHALMICGTEITNGSNQQSLTQPQTSMSDMGDPEESANLHIELTDCCQCLNGDHAFDRLKIGKFLEDECQVQVFEVKSARDGANVDCGESQVNSEVTPRTIQVISVKMNSKCMDDDCVE